MEKNRSCVLESTQEKNTKKADVNPEKIFKNIGEYCTANGIGKEEFIKMSGISSPVVYKMRNGYIPKKETLNRLAMFMGTSLDVLGNTEGLFGEEALRFLKLKENAKLNIEIYCIAKGITQKKFSEITGISNVTLWKIANGYQVKSSILKIIAESIDIPFEIFLSDAEEFAQILLPYHKRTLAQEILITCALTGTSKKEFAQMSGISNNTLNRIINDLGIEEETNMRVKQTVYQLKSNR